jgi:hypothetical protein
MVPWSSFEAAAPQLAAGGTRLLHARGDGEALLATVRAAELPRIHPVTVGIVSGRLYTFVIVGSAKLADLEQDGRYALHAHLDPAAPSEFSVRGRATIVRDDAVRAAVAATWPFTADEGYALFELGVEAALLGTRRSAEDWPPRYRRWSA